MSEFPTLQSKDGTMVVSFYPIKNPTGNISENWTLKVLEWEGINTVSKKFITKADRIREIRERLALDYVMIKDNSNLPQLGNPMIGAC